VNTDNFARAETHRMFRDLQANAGGINRLLHNRVPAAIDNQTVIRLNRDTLYSFAVLDLAAGATLTLPEHGDRYMSAMVVVAVRTLVGPSDPADLAVVTALQDQIDVAGKSAEPFAYPEYDPASFDETRAALLALARNLDSFDRTFGTRGEVDPVRHLIGTARGGAVCRTPRPRMSASTRGFRWVSTS
jgi:hypothetical protein